MIKVSNNGFVVFYLLFKLPKGKGESSLEKMDVATLHSMVVPFIRCAAYVLFPVETNIDQ